MATRTAGKEATEQLPARSERWVQRLSLEVGLQTALRLQHAGTTPDALGSPEELAAQMVDAFVPTVWEYDELLGPFVTSEAARKRLGISRQALHQRVARGRLLQVVTADGVHLYPLFQFDGREIRRGLGDVLAQFRDVDIDPWTIAAWLRSPEALLDGATPLDCLAERTEDVITAARDLAQHWRR